MGNNVNQLIKFILNLIRMDFVKLSKLPYSKETDQAMCPGFAVRINNTNGQDEPAESDVFYLMIVQKQ